MKTIAFILLFPLVIHLVSAEHKHEDDKDDDGDDINADARMGRMPEEDDGEDGAMGRFAKGDIFDTYNVTEGSSIDIDFASFLLTIPVKEEHDKKKKKKKIPTPPEAGCMQIPDDSHMPPGSKGEKHYGESCDPTAEFADPPNEAEICERWVTMMYEKKDHTWGECLKPSHFMCDPITRKCGCGQDSNMISQSRFQIGTVQGKNKKKGICYIRPTFDHIEGFECAPGTFKESVILDQDETPRPVDICVCPKHEWETFKTSDPEWWSCK